MIVGFGETVSDVKLLCVHTESWRVCVSVRVCACALSCSTVVGYFEKTLDLKRQKLTGFSRFFFLLHTRAKNKNLQVMWGQRSKDWNTHQKFAASLMLASTISLHFGVYKLIERCPVI